MESIKAPFTLEQVAALNTFQKDTRFHPFTCCGDEKSPSCKRRQSTIGREQKREELATRDVQWLKDQVSAIGNPHYRPDELETWQLLNIMVCQMIPYSEENEGILIAQEDGWICPCGEYRQDWAHAFMTEPLPKKQFEQTQNL